jgi:hypothetical protein
MLPGLSGFEGPDVIAGSESAQWGIGGHVLLNVFTFA